VIDGDDNIIVGVSADNEGDPDSIVLIKFDSSGEEIWQKDYTADGQYSNLELGAMVLSGTDIFVAADYDRRRAMRAHGYHGPVDESQCHRWRP
jgi:hypothetical protein